MEDETLRVLLWVAFGGVSPNRAPPPTPLPVLKSTDPPGVPRNPRHEVGEKNEQEGRRDARVFGVPEVKVLSFTHGPTGRVRGPHCLQ